MKHSEVTYLAKEICKANNKFMDAVFAASELVALDDLRSLISNQDPPAFRELCEKVAKYSDYESAAHFNDPTLDEASKMLSIIFLKAFE